MKALKNRRGLLFTVAAALFVIVLLSIVVLRIEQSREHGESLVYRIRCEELGTFLEDLEEDLERAGSIAGKRAALYATEYVVTEGVPLDDAIPPLEEMVLNGTFEGANVTSLENQTLTEWFEKMLPLLEPRHFTTNLNVDQLELSIVPYNAWEFRVRTQIHGLEVNDSYEYCSFSGKLPRGKTWINSNVSVIGLEDPSYVLNSKGYVSRLIVPDSLPLSEHGTPESILTDIEEKYYHAVADSTSFFEKLEGLHGLPEDEDRHNYYVDMAYNASIEEGLNISWSDIVIGSETFVNVDELKMYIPTELHYLIIKENQTCVDHLYFGPTMQGKKMYNVTDDYWWFRIDLEHSSIYNINESQLYE